MPGLWKMAISLRSGRNIFWNKSGIKFNKKVNSIIEAQQDFFEHNWIPQIMAPGLRMHRIRDLSGRPLVDIEQLTDRVWEKENTRLRQELKTQRWDNHLAS